MLAAGALVLYTRCLAAGEAAPPPSRARPGLRLGGVVCDYLAHRVWGTRWQQAHPLQTLRENGFDWVRVGVLTRSSSPLRATPPAEWKALPWRGEYWSSVEYAGEILREAQARGFRLNLFFHLSDQAAHAGRQEAPAEWKQLNLQQTADALQQHVYSTTRYYLDQGLRVELYELGNEIDCGLLGFTPGQRIPLPAGVDVNRDMDYMARSVWSIEALLLKSALAGLRRADPEAKVVLHVASLARPNGAVFTTSFFQAMVNEGVEFDYAGLSQPYPTQESWPLAGRDLRSWFGDLSAVIESLASLRKDVVFSEAAYPHSPDAIVGAPMVGLPFTPAGQAEWVRAQLAYANSNPHVAGFFYFYPEWFPGMSNEASTRSLESMGLFATDTEVQPAMRGF
jgi:arabinogalactan endo-1,4-beta-galactosidase